jgi:hypothetical protein
VPFELAHRFGNARVDWTVGALKVEPGRVAFWLEAAGMFEQEHIRERLAGAGIPLEPGDAVRTTRLPFGIELTLDQGRLHLASPDLGEAGGTDLVAALRAAGLGEAPVWAHLPAASSLLAAVELPAKPRGVTLAVTFEPGLAVLLRSEHELAVHARAVASLLVGLRKQARDRLEDFEESPALARATAALEAAQIVADGTTVRVALDLTAIGADDAERLLLELARRVQ